ncbi:MAG: PIN domain-containing protein [Protaetiibacter sp.]
MTAFVDTNILVYAFDADERSKQQAAQSLLLDAPDRLVVSTQVLHEFYVTVTRRFRRLLEPDQAAAEVERFSRLPVVVTDVPLIRAAIVTSRAYPISYWDALIVEAAVAAGCDRILTEDLGDGDVIRGVRIENPFRSIGGDAQPPAG